MERLSYIFFFAAAFLIAAPVFGSNTILYTFNDTYNSTTTYALFSPTTNQTVAHGQEDKLVLGLGTTASYMWAKQKFDLTTTSAFSHILTGLTWNYFTVNTGCQFLFNEAAYLSNDTSWTETVDSGDWNDSLLAGWNDTAVYLNNSNGYHSYPIALTSGYLMKDLYGTQINRTLVYLEMVGHQCVTSGTSFNISSIEGGNPSFLNLTTADYVSGIVHAENVNTIFFDFETGQYVNDSELDPYFSFAIDTENNIVGDLFASMANLGGSAENPNTFPHTVENASLGTLSCTSFAYPQANSAIYGLNEPSATNASSGKPLPEYDTICFNLTMKHNGQFFTGAIKLINISSDNLTFYWAMYSPSFSTFGYPSLSPFPVYSDLNLTISWDTTIPLTTILKYRYNNSGDVSGWFYETNFSNYSTAHTVTINHNNLYPYSYNFYMQGNDSSGANYTSPLYNFTVFGSYIGTFENQSAPLPQTIERLTQTGFCSDTTSCTYILGGFLVAIIAAFGFWAGGMRVGLPTVLAGITLFSLIGLLPIYLLLPVIVLGAYLATGFFKKLFGGGNDNG